jgi:hypothetical protein
MTILELCDDYAAQRNNIAAQVCSIKNGGRRDARPLLFGPQAGQIDGGIFYFSVSFIFLGEYGVLGSQEPIRAGSNRDQVWISMRSVLDQTRIRITSFGHSFFTRSGRWRGFRKITERIDPQMTQIQARRA